MRRKLAVVFSKLLEEILLVPELYLAEVVEGCCALVRSGVGCRGDELRISTAALDVPPPKERVRLLRVGRQEMPIEAIHGCDPRIGE